MSDDYDGGGDTGGGDYSSNNDYSGIGSTFSAFESAMDFTSAVESTTSAVDNNYSSNARSANDYSGVGTTVSAFESATESYNNVESSRSAFDNNDYSSTKLQIDDVPSTGRYVSSGGNFSKRSNYSNGTRYTKYTPSNSTWTDNTSSSAECLGNCNDSVSFMICISVILLVIIFSGLIVAAHSHRPSTYKPIKLEPLPQGVYNSEKIDWAEFERNLNNSLKLF